MKRFISQYYLMPEKLVFQIINHLNKNINKIILGLTLVLLCYPIMQWVNLTQQFSKTAFILENVNKEIITKEQLLQNKLAEKGNKYNQDLTPTKISQQLETLFHQYNAEINVMQWDLSQDKQIHITITQKSNKLFELIHQLNQLKNLRFKEMTLSRLDYKNLVQFNATLQLVNQ